MKDLLSSARSLSAYFNIIQCSSLCFICKDGYGRLGGFCVYGGKWSSYTPWVKMGMEGLDFLKMFCFVYEEGD